MEGMSAGVKSRSAARGTRPQSLFYRDLSASPATRASSVRGDVITANHAAAAALWRENIGGGVDPPPPPFHTLEDRMEKSPESTSDLSFRSPDAKFSEKTVSFKRTVHSPPSGRGGFGLPNGENQGPQGSPVTPQQLQASETKSWWSPLRERLDNKEAGKREEGTPTGGLVTPSAPPEIIRPEFLSAATTEKSIEGEEWVTVFGFGVDETNAVMREFEKCGPIVNHVSGPDGANWIYIQYQNSYDALKALHKNGTQLNGALIVGVKSLDPLQRQALSEKVNRSALSFVTRPPRTPSKGISTAGDLTELGGLTTASRPISAIASPAKSTLSKLVDLVFGI